MIQVILEGPRGGIQTLNAKPETDLDSAVGFAEEMFYERGYNRTAVIVDGEIYCEYER